VRLFDAHNHLHDRRLAPFAVEMVAEMKRVGVAGAMVNGTQEEDWAAVADWGRQHAWARLSFGVHPWHVVRRSADWLAGLEAQLEAHPEAGVGEIGLDRWVEGHDLEQQMAVFAPQLELAAAQNRPVTIHCLKAWGALWDHLRTNRLPERGFLLHSYGGPAEMIEGFVRLGGYFSLSPYFLAERKREARENFAKVPPERLLVETDAPDMFPPEERDRHGLHEAESGARLNHPANLVCAYEGLAAVRGWSIEELAGRAEENYARLYAPNA
jgi:TatD DNase family protein